MWHGKKNKVSLKKGKTYKLGAKAIAQSKKLKVKKHRAIAYESSNKKVATVSGKGVIKGVGKGTCYVYAYAQNGVCKKIKVFVNWDTLCGESNHCSSHDFRSDIIYENQELKKEYWCHY